MKVDIEFPEVLSPHNFTAVPIVLGEGYGPSAGTIKHVKIKPGTRVPTLLDTKWEKNREGRPNRLRKVELLESQVDAGCFLLQEQYEAEKWPEGWKAYEKWMTGCYPRKGPGGKMVRPSRGKPFPESKLPKRVLELRGRAAVKVKEAEVPADLMHPDDLAKARRDAAEAEAKAAKPKATTKTVEPEGESAKATK
jgi:hypothetical protein